MWKWWQTWQTKPSHLGVYIPYFHVGPCLVNPKNGLGVLNFGHAKIKGPSVKFFWSRKLYRLTGFEDYFNWCIEHDRTSSNDSSGWWFGPFFIFQYIGNSNHQLTSIFFRGAATINQRVTHVVALLKTAILACQDIPQVYQRLAFRDSIFQLKKITRWKFYPNGF